VYRIPDDIAKEVWDYLDHREKDGYTRKVVDVHGMDDQGNDIIVEKDVSPLSRPTLEGSAGQSAQADMIFSWAQCRVYVGETDNPSFGGGLPMQELAQCILDSKGPSGPNKVQ
jgi:cation transport regulator ChaC